MHDIADGVRFLGAIAFFAIVGLGLVWYLLHSIDSAFAMHALVHGGGLRNQWSRDTACPQWFARRHLCAGAW
jgi:hypothetical protein